jgi:hypothetical protein
MNRLFHKLLVLSFIFTFGCNVADRSKASDSILGELGVNAMLGLATDCSVTPSTGAVIKEWAGILVQCPIGSNIDYSNDSILIKYTSLAAEDVSTSQNLFVERLTNESFKIKSNKELISGKIDLTLSGVTSRDGSTLLSKDFTFTIDLLSPNVTSSFPSGIYDVSIFLTNQYDLTFSEPVKNAEDLSKYSIQNSNGGTLNIRNIAKLNSTSIRAFWQGTFPREGGTMSVMLSGIEDSAGNKLKNTLSYKILGWSDGPTLNQARKDFQTAQLSNGNYLVIGGSGPVSGTATALNTVEKLDAITGLFTYENNLTTPRRLFSSSITTDDQILIAGGFLTTATASITNTTNIYNPTSKVWSSGPNLSSNRIGHASCLLSGNRVLVTGGRTTNLGSAVSTAEIITLNGAGGGTIMTLASMSTARMNHSCVNLPDGRIWIVGGSTVQTEYFTPDVSGGNFSTGPNLIIAQSSMVTLTDASNNVYLIGGNSGSLTTDIVQKYDANTGLVSINSYMAKARFNHVGAVLPDGNFLIHGGSGSSGGSGLSDVEKIWKTTNLDAFVLPSSEQARTGHQLIKLSNGKLLLLGGISGVGIPDYLKTTEIFGY